MYLLKIYQHVRLILSSYIQFFLLSFIYIYKKIFNNKTNIFNYRPGVTVVITCCNRSDKLSYTLASFFKHNTCDVDKFIVIEDGLCKESFNVCLEFIGEDKLHYIYNNENIGQLKSIKKAYSFVETEYVFHLEEDWIFIKDSFIEYSLDILNSHIDCLFVSLRDSEDQNNHPLIDYDNNFYKLKPFWKFIWVGFGYNPSLRRIVDYNLLPNAFDSITRREIVPGLLYYFLGFKILVSKSNCFVVHNGWECSTEHKYKKA